MINHPVSPLRQRMIEDMTLRKLNERTQTTYIRGVVRLTARVADRCRLRVQLRPSYLTPMNVRFQGI